MNTIRTIAAAALSVVLAACGGGGEPAPVVKAPTACTPAVVTIGLYGDSTQYGETRDGANGAPYRVAAYPEALIQSAMDARFGAGAVVVQTRAIIGTRLDQLLAGHQGTVWGTYGDAWPAGAADDIEVENFGINDYLHGVTPATFDAELRAMFAARRVVLETPLPEAGDDGLAPTVRTVATSLGATLIDANDYVHSLPDWSQYLGDGIHPTNDGYAVVVNGAVIPALTAMVAPLRCEATP